MCSLFNDPLQCPLMQNGFFGQDFGATNVFGCDRSVTTIPDDLNRNRSRLGFDFSN